MLLLSLFLYFRNCLFQEYAIPLSSSSNSIHHNEVDFAFETYYL